MATNARVTLQNAEVLYVAASETTNSRLSKVWVNVVWDTNATTVARASKVWADVIWDTNTTTVARASKVWADVVWAESTGTEESADNTLSLSDAASAAGSILNLSLTDPISFTDEAARNRNPGSLLQLDDTVTATPGTIINIDVDDTLVLEYDFPGNFSKNFSNTDQLILVDEADWRHTLSGGQGASDTITFTDAVEGFRGTESILSLIQVASAEVEVLGGDVDSTLTLVDTVDPLLVTLISVSSTLDLEDEVVVDQVSSIAPTSTLSLSDIVAGTVAQDYCVLQAPNGAVVLPRPELQDAENLNHQVDVDVALDGTVFTYVQRHETRRLDYTFTMSRAQSLRLQVFLETYNSEWLTFINWKAEVWRVKLDTNPVTYSTNKRDNRVDVHLTFDGTKLSG